MERPQVLELTPEEAEGLTGGSWHGPKSPVRLRGAAIDSRKVRDGMIFACCVGARVDGHDYAATAVGDGAALVLAGRELDTPVPAPVLVVPDVTIALGALAATFRDRYDEATWIGITGSNGKTTVKELVAAACGGQDLVHATAGNYNNQLGVPLTILNTPAEKKFIVVEMGASGPGDIDELAAIARPEVGVITCIGPAHLEGFGDLYGVARGKSALFGHVVADGRCLFATDGLAPDLAGIVRAAAGERLVVEVGGVGCPIHGTELPRGVVLNTPVGDIQLRLDGRHNLVNACLAWHTAVAAGADPKQALAGLAAVRPATGRLQVRRLGQHRVFDDSYNANPASMAAGLSVLSRQPGARLAVLGAMGELGGGSDVEHQRVGAVAAREGLPLITVGAAAEAIGLGYVEAGGRDHVAAVDTDAAAELIQDRLRVGPTAILVKASRSAGLERVVEALTDAFGYAGTDSGETPAC